MIAAILAFTVDRFVKEHFIYDVSKDVFHYIIGYDVPVEVKERIKELLHIAVIASNRVISIKIEPKSKTRVSVRFNTQWKIKNLTRTAQLYTPRLMSDESDRPQFLSHRVISRNVNYSWDGTEVKEHVIHNSATGVYEFVGQPIDLEPEASVGEYTIKWDYVLTMPREYVHADVYGTPTKGTTVIADHPPDFDVIVGNDFKRVGNEWSTDRMFLRGEFITIQWRVIQEGAIIAKGKTQGS